MIWAFEHPDIAGLMNEHFVCVKVDREERPDVDAIYMEAVQAMTDLCAAVEIPAGLRSFGVPEEAIPAMAVEAAGIERLMRNNPRKLSAVDIEKIYRAAY